MAAVVASSHFPVGSAFSAPSRFKAVWISRIRSGVGAVWPLTLGFAFFLPLLLDEMFFFFFADVCAAAVDRAVDTTGAALTRSTAPRIENHVFSVIGSSSKTRP